MPEIAEVAVYAHDLNKLIKGKKLTNITYNGDKGFREKIVSKETRSQLKEMVGQENTFSSKGKSLYLKSKGHDAAVLFKLGMTGMFQTVEPSEDAMNRHAFITFEFEKMKVYYLDFRRFGRVTPFADDHLELAGFDGNKFYTATREQIAEIIPQLKGWKKQPKITWLLNHGPITGTGNYLANEALGRLNLNPFTPCKDEKECILLLEKVAEIALESFKHGGNSFKGGYYRLTGERGEYYKYCQFYRNAKIPCHTFRGRPIYTLFEMPKAD